MIAPKVVLIAAVELSGGIGLRGRIPWSVPEDLAHFARTTKDATIVVGRKTHDTLPRLPGRTIYVLSRRAPNACRSPEEVINLAADAGDEVLYVAGGGEVYSAFLPYASEIILTRVLDFYEADVRFPVDEIDPAVWETERVESLSPRAEVRYIRRRER